MFNASYVYSVCIVSLQRYWHLHVVSCREDFKNKLRKDYKYNMIDLLENSLISNLEKENILIKDGECRDRVCECIENSFIVDVVNDYWKYVIVLTRKDEEKDYLGFIHKRNVHYRQNRYIIFKIHVDDKDRMIRLQNICREIREIRRLHPYKEFEKKVIVRKKAVI